MTQTVDTRNDVTQRIIDELGRQPTTCEGTLFVSNFTHRDNIPPWGLIFPDDCIHFSVKVRYDPERGCLQIRGEARRRGDLKNVSSIKWQKFEVPTWPVKRECDIPLEEIELHPGLLDWLVKVLHLA